MTGVRHLVAVMALGAMIVGGQNVTPPRLSEAEGGSPPPFHREEMGGHRRVGPTGPGDEVPHHRGQRRIGAPFEARWEEEHHEEDPLAEFEALERDEEVEARAMLVAGSSSREWILSPGADPTTTTGDAASSHGTPRGARNLLARVVPLPGNNRA